MSEVFSVRVKSGVKEQIKLLSHAENTTVSELLSRMSNSQCTFIAEKAGTLKIGLSVNPFDTAKKFGKLVAVIDNPLAEKYLLGCLDKAPEIIEDGWVSNSIGDVLEKLNDFKGDFEAVYTKDLPDDLSMRVSKHFNLHSSTVDQLKKASGNHRTSSTQLIEAAVDFMLSLPETQVNELLREARKNASQYESDALMSRLNSIAEDI